MDFGGKVVPGLQGANLRTVHRRMYTGECAWATKPAHQSVGNGAAMWMTVFLGFGCAVERHL